MKPDKPKTTFSVLVREGETKVPPTVIFSTTSLKWISAMVDLHPHEVGFYATVDERENYSFYIRDVFYPKHSEMNGGTCEISPEGENDIMTWLMDRGRGDDIEKMRLWGHSHHTMGTGPSGQDEKQALARMNATKSFLIRIICNKDGEISCSFFDYERKLRFDHIKWMVEEDSDESYWESNIGRIASIIGNTNSSAKKKIDDIKNIINTDHQYESIKKKVEELKKINEPTIGNHARVTRGFQENIFGEYEHNFEDYERDDRGNYHYRKRKKTSRSGVNLENFDEELDSMVERDDNKDSIQKMLEDYENGMGVIK